MKETLKLFNTNQKFKIYCKITLLKCPQSQNALKTLQAKISKEIHQLSNKGYWAFSPKIKFTPDAINFGYPWDMITNLLSNVFTDEFCDKLQPPSDPIQRSQYLLKLQTTFSYKHKNLESHVKKLTNAYKKAAQKIPTTIKVNKNNPKYSNHDLNAFFEETLSNREINGLIIGENHHSIYPKGLLINYINLLKNLGVTTIFLERFIYKFHQPLLDAYFKSQNDELPIELKAIATKADEVYNLGKFGYENIIKTCKKNNIRIVALDDLSSRLSANFRCYFWEQRIPGFNYYAANIIAKEIKLNEKYIALVGKTHSSDCNKILGLRSILNKHFKHRSVDLAINEGGNRSSFSFTQCQKLSVNNEEIVKSSILRTWITFKSNICITP